MQTDKLLHLVCGYCVALTAGLWQPWVGALAGVAAAYGKEYVWDKWLGRGMFEREDIIWSLVGVIAGFIVACIRAI